MLELIWWQVQTRLDERVIEYRVVFAARHEGEASQVRKHSPSAILSIQPEQGALRLDLVCNKVATEGREGLAQFHSVESVASIAKRAEPLGTVGLTDDGARTDDFAKPRGRRGDRLRRGLDDQRSIGDTVHMYLLEGKCFVLPSQRGHILCWLATF